MNKVKEYKICKERGHSATSFFSLGMGPQIGVCTYCGTHFWTESIDRESNIPE